jgi:hypothetical protein
VRKDITNGKLARHTDKLVFRPIVVTVRFFRLTGLFQGWNRLHLLRRMGGRYCFGNRCYLSATGGRLDEGGSYVASNEAPNAEAVDRILRHGESDGRMEHSRPSALNARCVSFCSSISMYIFIGTVVLWNQILNFLLEEQGDGR